MAIGPVQLVVLGFEHPNFQGEIIAELERLRDENTIRVIDSLVIYKTPEGDIEVERLSNLDLGATVAALIGLDIEGEESLELAADADAELSDDDIEDAWDVLADIPNDSAAALLLLEHHWAIPLRDAIARAGGFRIDDAFISPVDLVAIGLLQAEEAAHHALETQAS
jgi:hypothetical protein